ncbi:BTAD domain-containing putative transcriptional regulator [Streptomyces sp. NPDC002004]
MRGELRFGLIGPPVVFDEAGEPRPVGSAKGRVLLAALLLEAGRVVSVDALKDALWGGAPPASAHASLQNHVTRLRRLLDDPERLRAVPPGYRLHVGEGELDVRVFEARVAAARAAHAGRDWARAAQEAADALALWRGTPLSGLPAEIGGHALAQRLDEARLLALEWRYEAELHLGSGAEIAGIAPELAELVAEYPLREAFHRQLMMVLHQAGRQAEALAVHRELRRTLIEELGVEPGPAVREAHRLILAGPVSAGSARGGPSSAAPRADRSTVRRPAAAAGSAGAPGAAYEGASGTVPGGTSSAAAASGPHGSTAPQVSGASGGAHPGSGRGALTAQAASSVLRGGDTPAKGASSPTSPRPAQLPPAPAHFTGRACLVAELRRALAAPREDGFRVAVVSGMAGVGKSALAVQVAHGLRDRFPDGQLYVHLHGATPGVKPLSPRQALAALLRDLGADPRRIPEHQDAAAALLRSLLAPTRTLMVLDDAASAAQVRPLLPAGTGCAVIVTSRSPLTALDGANRFALGPLSAEDSAALLRTVSGRDGLDGAHPLVDLAGRLPLALRIVAARLAARRALTPDALADLLTATGGRLHHLEYDDLSVRRSLAVAHEALRTSDRETDRDAARVLLGIGALDLPAYGVPLLAHLSRTDERRAEAALDRLVDVALLEETAYGRYAPHDLVRDFAREAAYAAARAAGDGARDGEVDGEADGSTAQATADTALHWYTESARQTLLALEPSGWARDDRLHGSAEPLTPDVAVPAFPTPENALAWADRELANVVALAARYAHTSALVPKLVRFLFPYLQRRGRLAELEVLGRQALDAARRLGDAEGEAVALTDLAGLHFMKGQGDEALALNDAGLALWQQLGITSCIRRGLNHRGLLLERLGRYPESDEALQQSLALSRELGDTHGEAITFSHLGNLYEHTDARTAIEYHERSLALGEEMGSVLIRQTARCNIGYAHLTLGEPAAAARHFEASLRIIQEDPDWHGESQSRLGHVRALRELGRFEHATSECDLLLDLAAQRADRFTEGLARQQKGLLLHVQGLKAEAYEEWHCALDALDGTDSPEIAVLTGLLADR